GQLATTQGQVTGLQGFDSSTDINYYPTGLDTGIGIDSRADSGSSTSTGLNA
ncbi:hypothetical protein KI387_027930, partial [Taxus chinensis]